MNRQEFLIDQIASRAVSRATGVASHRDMSLDFHYGPLGQIQVLVSIDGGKLLDASVGEIEIAFERGFTIKG